jgi:hypothetical protein
VLIPPRRGFALRDAIVRSQPHSGTDTERGKSFADGRGYDRLIVITDEQSSTVVTAPKGIGYLVNVAGYKNGIGYGPWVQINGWSEAILSYIQQAELTRSPTPSGDG